MEKGFSQVWTLRVIAANETAFVARAGRPVRRCRKVIVGRWLVRSGSSAAPLLPVSWVVLESMTVLGCFYRWRFASTCSPVQTTTADVTKAVAASSSSSSARTHGRLLT